MQDTNGQVATLGNSFTKDWIDATGQLIYKAEG